MKIISNSVNQTLKIGKRIARGLKRGDIICLFGQLGSGKTVLTKGIASGLGIEKDKVISPTFVFIREYQARMSFYHLDLYRLNKPEEILVLGYEEYLYDDGIAVIEWADKLKYLLPRQYLKIRLEIKAKTQRRIEIIPYGRHYEELTRKFFKEFNLG